MSPCPEGSSWSSGIMFLRDLRSNMNPKIVAAKGKLSR